MHEGPISGPTGTQISSTLKMEGASAGGKGIFNGRKVEKHEPLLALKGFLKTALQTKTKLYERTITPVSNDQREYRPLPKASKASSVLPEFIPDKVKQAPDLDSVKKVKLLGKGSFGEVSLVTNKQSKKALAENVGQLQKQYVVKKQKLKKGNDARAEQLNDLKKEVAIQKSAPGAPTIAHERVKSGKHEMVMEYAGSPLSTLMKDDSGKVLQPVPRNLARDLTQQLLETVSRHHDEGTIHRDIKPDNILIDHKGQLKLVDYGVSDQVEKEKGRNSRFDEIVGSPAYMAPEVARAHPYTVKADVFSLGVVIAEMMTGTKADFVRVQQENGDIKISHPTLFLRGYLKQIERHPGIDPLAKDLLLKMLERNPAKRISSDEALKHPYFTQSSSPEQMSYPELQTRHQALFQQLASAEKQLDDAESQIKGADLKGYREELEAVVADLGKQIIELQGLLEEKEHIHTSPQAYAQPEPESLVTESDKNDSQDQVEAPEVWDFGDTMIQKGSSSDSEFGSPEGIEDIEDTMIIKEDLSAPDSDIFDGMDDTMIIKEDTGKPKK